MSLVPGKLLCITGIDGAGKTTTGKSVTSTLRAADIDAVYVYGKYRPVLFLPCLWLSRLVFLRGLDQSQEYERHRDTKQEMTKRHSMLATIYLLLLSVDYFIQIVVKLGPPLLQGKIVICDRYVFDTVIIDIATDFNYTTQNAINLAYRFFTFCPVPDRTYLLDVPICVSMERKNDVPDPEYLRDRHDLFLAFSNEFDMVQIDGTNDVEVVVRSILADATDCQSVSTSLDVDV